MKPLIVLLLGLFCTPTFARTKDNETWVRSHNPGWHMLASASGSLVGGQDDVVVVLEMPATGAGTPSRTLKVYAGQVAGDPLLKCEAKKAVSRDSDISSDTFSLKILKGVLIIWSGGGRGNMQSHTELKWRWNHGDMVLIGVNADEGNLGAQKGEAMEIKRDINLVTLEMTERKRMVVKPSTSDNVDEGTYKNTSSHCRVSQDYQAIVLSRFDADGFDRRLDSLHCDGHFSQGLSPQHLPHSR